MLLAHTAGDQLRVLRAKIHYHDRTDRFHSGVKKLRVKGLRSKAACHSLLATGFSSRLHYHDVYKLPGHDDDFDDFPAVQVLLDFLFRQSKALNFL